MMIPDSSMEYPRVAFELSCVEFRAAELDLNILLKSLNMVKLEQSFLCNFEFGLLRI